VREHRKKPARHVSRNRAAPLSLAPLSHIVAAARIPLPPPAGEERPYRSLAGIALAILAIAGSCLLVLSQRVFRVGWE